MEGTGVRRNRGDEGEVNFCVRGGEGEGGGGGGLSRSGDTCVQGPFFFYVDVDGRVVSVVFFFCITAELLWGGLAPCVSRLLGPAVVDDGGVHGYMGVWLGLTFYSWCCHVLRPGLRFASGA